MKKTISVSMARRDGGLNQALQRLAIRETTAARATTFWALCMRTVRP